MKKKYCIPFTMPFEATTLKELLLIWKVYVCLYASLYCSHFKVDVINYEKFNFTPPFIIAVQCGSTNVLAALN